MSKGRLLIVDDEVELLQVLAEQVSMLGFECATASSAAKALAVIEGFQPDAVLSDINMPKMSGLQLFEEFKRIGVRSPVIFLTGYGDRATVVSALRLGAFDFLEKPHNWQDLSRVVTGAIELGQELKNVETEVEALVGSLKVTDLEREKLKRITRQVVSERKWARAGLKKAQ